MTFEDPFQSKLLYDSIFSQITVFINWNQIILLPWKYC